MQDSDAALNYLRFRLCTVTCALPLAVVREVLPMAELTRPPRLVDTVEGLLTVGESSYPVLRLDRLLGLEGFTAGPDTHLLLARNLARPAVLMVDRVLGVDRVDALEPVADFVTAHACVRTQYRDADGPVHVLDLGTLLGLATPGLKVVA